MQERPDPTTVLQEVVRLRVGHVGKRKKNHTQINPGPCFFNHPTTSLMDARGRPRWNAAPTKPPLWPGLPPGATLCQRCYEHYRTAEIKGVTATVPATPRLLAMSTARGPASSKLSTHAEHLHDGDGSPSVRTGPATVILQSCHNTKSVQPPDGDPRQRRLDKATSHHSVIPHGVTGLHLDGPSPIHPSCRQSKALRTSRQPPPFIIHQSHARPPACGTATNPADPL